MNRSASKRQQEIVRFQAIDLFLNGTDPRKIALQLDVQQQSVYLWIRLFKTRGRDSLRAKPQNGNPKVLPKAPIHEIRDLLAKGPKSAGLNHKHWNGPTIVLALKTKWGIELHPKYVYRWLERNDLKGVLNRSFKLATIPGSEEMNCTSRTIIGSQA